MLTYGRCGGFARFAVGGLVLMWVATATAPAAEEEKKPRAVADISQVDQDYALQGEFSGAIRGENQKDRVIALQVRTLGQGRFQAMQFEGGLPGQTPRPVRPVWLVGKRSEQFLVLSGGPWAVLVHPDHCLLVDQSGQSVGQLQRVYRESPTLGAKPPKQATVLFDGSGINLLANARVTDNGLLMEGANVIPMFQDFDLHLEFMLPYMPTGSGQGRANSGVYLQSRYEVQILDSFAMSTIFNGCGSLYRYRSADVNMCLPPLVWQTYDISFTGPRWAADGKKLKNARITVWHNGVKIHDDFEVQRKTGAGAEEQVVLLPIRLQDHGCPVRFRNIWLVDRGADGWVKFPVKSTEEEKAKARGSAGAVCTPIALEEGTRKPAAKERVQARPVSAKPATEKPATEKPAAEKPSAEKPPKNQAQAKPAPDKPAEKPTAEKPAAKEPPKEKPAPDKPAAKPATEKPAAEKPAAEKPAAKEASKEAAAKEKPAVEKPAADTSAKKGAK